MEKIDSADVWEARALNAEILLAKARVKELEMQGKSFSQRIIEKYKLSGDDMADFTTGVVRRAAPTGVEGA